VVGGRWSVVGGRLILSFQIQIKQLRLPQEATNKACPACALLVVGAVVGEVAFLTQGAQVGMPVVGRVLVKMRGGENHGAVIGREKSPLSVQHVAALAATFRPDEANVVRELLPVRRVIVFDL
jgi:hypothetical protein